MTNSPHRAEPADQDKGDSNGHGASQASRQARRHQAAGRQGRQVLLQVVQGRRRPGRDPPARPGPPGAAGTDGRLPGWRLRRAGRGVPGLPAPLRRAAGAGRPHLGLPARDGRAPGQGAAQRLCPRGGADHRLAGPKFDRAPARRPPAQPARVPGRRAAAAATGRFVAAHRLALEGGTIALLVGLAAYGLLRRPRGLGWLVAVLALLAVTAVVTRPVSASRLAGQAGVAVPNLVLRAAVQGDPTQELRGGTQQVQEALAGGYWTAFVAEPLSRLQTGTAVLADAPPTRKPGVLGFLRGRIGAVNDWAVGRHGVERSVISTFAVVYVLPFALVLCALAMLAT